MQAQADADTHITNDKTASRCSAEATGETVGTEASSPGAEKRNCLGLIPLPLIHGNGAGRSPGLS